MNILIVEDNYMAKCFSSINHLMKQMPFTYQITSNANSACRYIENFYDEINLVILDLGLPQFPDNSGYNELNGLQILHLLLRKYPEIPVIVNSTTAIPEEEKYIEKFNENHTFYKHVKRLDKEWLYELVSSMMN